VHAAVVAGSMQREGASRAPAAAVTAASTSFGTSCTQLKLLPSLRAVPSMMDQHSSSAQSASSS
jgi:hypothetical protein